MIKNALEHIDLDHTPTQRKLKRDIEKLLSPDTIPGEVFQKFFEHYSEKFQRAKTEETLLERMTYGALRKIDKEDDYDSSHIRGCTIQSLHSCLKYSFNHDNIEKVAIMLATHNRLAEMNNEKAHTRSVQEVAAMTGAAGSKKKVSEIDKMTRSLEETIESMQSRKTDFQASKPKIDMHNISRIIDEPVAKKDFGDIEDQLAQALKSL